MPLYSLGIMIGPPRVPPKSFWRREAWGWRIEKDGPHWYYDEEDPDESPIVLRMRRVYLLTDSNGKMIEVSTEYQDLGIDSAASIRSQVRAALASYRPESAGMSFWTERRNAENVPYLIRAGIVFDERHTAPYYVAIGTPLENNERVLAQYTWFCVGLIPAALFLGSWLGWFMAGRALTPVLEVAQAGHVMQAEHARAVDDRR